jgi:hypothetical protein
VSVSVALVLALPVFLASTVAFDVVHWLLHRLLRARSPWLRALARPHAVHHEWLDGRLRIHPDRQWGNVWCHLLPEYLTQIAFTALVATVLPPRVVVATLGLQTAVFATLLWQRGLDVNHRPIAVLDAYRPLLFCLPEYHALHHVHPDAHFSAYVKLVDWLVGSGAWLGGRRVTMVGSDTTAFGRALRRRLEQATGLPVREVAGPGAAVPPATEILVLCDARDEAAIVEPFLHATRSRQLPPEVWCVRAEPSDATARHYWGDVRVIHRLVVVPDAIRHDDARADAAARRALSGVRRGFNWVPTTGLWSAIPAWWRFRRTRPRRPEVAPLVRSRAELAGPVAIASSLC